MRSTAGAKALASLLGPDIEAPAAAAQLLVTGLTADSRKVEPGMLFAALPGSRTDGARFAAEAAARGAVAVLTGYGAQLSDLAVPLLRAADPRRALALMAARYYGGQPEVAVAVTGTSGKTSVAEFARQLYALLGRRAASLGTLGIITPSAAVYGSLTTPDPVSLAAALADLARDGITHLALEASSHGLDQRRLDGIELSAAAFTNLGRDHLDYHRTMEAYLAAKLRLFSELLPAGRAAVLNADDTHASQVAAAARARGLEVLTTGVAGDSLKLLALKPGPGFGQQLLVSHNGGKPQPIAFPLLGAYQASNALLAAGLVLATERSEDPNRVLAALAALSGIRGRLEIVGRRNGGLAVVDYAHKPEALAAALSALRPFAHARLVCVFGCGGDRDKGKRPIMGRIAVEKADVVIVTDDNPRSEDPAAIRKEILAGAAGAAKPVHEIGDRAQAIAFAVRDMGAGDVVLVAGKGHETGQIVGERLIPFSDQEVLLDALRGRRHG
ncbi:MAG TPA: UDP-N-acetylmuramoyl-L-alanyl-D-glutamate--2,6-diaminopimelate ligase [Hyphomicrobiaceae bacterium]|nr:UDP-N-acetylmuramoyl-L-alanyl-D-glutamate--2,6-diaminopimelate ligase [Hyphomicrobiaceae bacterium]